MESLTPILNPLRGVKRKAKSAESARPYIAFRLVSGAVSTDGDLTALSVPKATLWHCRNRRILHGTVGTERYSATLSVQ